MQVEDYKQLSVLLERVIHKYIQIEQRPWDYGNGILLSRAEIHTIMLVHGEPGISVTALARKRGITKGAASQLIYKLVNKGLVEKRVSPQSDAQVSLYLTETGQETSRLHDAYHQSGAESFMQYLSDMPDETMAALIDVMQHFDQGLDARLDSFKK